MNLLLIDDDIDWLEDMVDLLASFPENHEVTAIQPVQGTEFCLSSCSPDVIGLDLNMRPLDGLQLAYMFSWRQPIPILMISAHVSSYSLANLQAAGIKGYLTKDQVISKLKPALKSLYSGKTWFPDLMLNENQHLERSEYKKACLLWHKLTIRQKDICFLLLGGDSPREICQRLGLSSDTVKDHLKEIRSIFQVHHSYALMRQLHQLIPTSVGMNQVLILRRLHGVLKHLKVWGGADCPEEDSPSIYEIPTPEGKYRAEN